MPNIFSIATKMSQSNPIVDKELELNSFQKGIDIFKYTTDRKKNKFILLV